MLNYLYFFINEENKKLVVQNSFEEDFKNNRTK